MRRRPSPRVAPSIGAISACRKPTLGSRPANTAHRRGSGAAGPRRHAAHRQGARPCFRASSRRPAVYGLLWIVILRHFPAAGRDWRVVVLVLAAARARLRLAARVPRARLPRRRRLLVARADGPDRARPLRRQRPRLQRRRAPDGQPRRWSRRALFLLAGDARSAHGHRRVLRARRDGERTAGLATRAR